MNIDRPVDLWKHRVWDQCEVIRRHLPRHLAITRLRPVPADSWNAIFCADAPARRYCVKVMNEECFLVGWTAEELDATGRAMTALRDAGLDGVLPPIALDEGRSACRYAGYTVVVFPWCDGFDAPRPGPGADGRRGFVRAGAPALHELHLRGRPVAAPTTFARKYGPAAWLHAGDALWVQSAAALERAGADAALLGVLERARQEVPAAVARCPAFYAGSREGETLLHGDFRPENVLIERDRMRLIYDFDFHRCGLPEEDVAYSALAFSGPRWFTGHRDWRACADFLRAYQDAACRRGHGLLRPEMLEAALSWTLLKELSLSFRPAEVPGRYALWQELQAAMDHLRGACE